MFKSLQQELVAMNPPIFSDTATVNLQGEYALLCIGANYSCAQYKINGFQELQFFLTDHRDAGVMAYQEWLISGDMNHFLSQINTPAFVLVTPAGERAWMIDLYDTGETLPINTLSIGIQAAAPLYIHNYEFYHEETAGREGYNILAIFQNDPEPIPAYSYIPAFS